MVATLYVMPTKSTPSPAGAEGGRTAEGWSGEACCGEPAHKGRVGEGFTAAGANTNARCNLPQTSSLFAREESSIMTEPPIASREAALRIAHAARLLEHIETRAFVEALAERYGLPLTEARLMAVTVEDLRELLAGNHADASCVVGVPLDTLKAVIRLFKGEGVEGSDLPSIDLRADEEMPNSLRVAVASNHGEELDGHFGSCERFLIYRVSPETARLVEIRSALDADREEDRNAARAALVADCQILYLQSIGGPAAAKVVRAGVHPIKQPGGGPAREAIARLQTSLHAPPPWLARAMGVPAASLTRYAQALAVQTEG
jgi:nitrogen fixation protein NifX